MGEMNMIRNPPRISIVIPTYNAEFYLPSCLESIRRQQYKNLEVIIADGLSSDGTLKVAAKYADVVTRVISERDSGQADAVTKGLRLATGDIHHWHAADDILMKGALATVAEQFSRDENVGLVISDGLTFSDQLNYVNYTARCFAARFETALLFFDRFQSDCTYWRSRATKSCLPLDSRYPITVDEEFFLRVWSIERRHIRVNQPLGAFRVRPNQISGNYDPADVMLQRRIFRARLAEKLQLESEKVETLRMIYWGLHQAQLVARLVHKVGQRSLDVLNANRRKAKLDWIRSCHVETS